VGRLWGGVISPVIPEVPRVFCGKTGHFSASETPHGASLQWGGLPCGIATVETLSKLAGQAGTA